MSPVQKAPKFLQGTSHWRNSKNGLRGQDCLCNLLLPCLECIPLQDGGQIMRRLAQEKLHLRLMDLLTTATSGQLLPHVCEHTVRLRERKSTGILQALCSDLGHRKYLKGFPSLISDSNYTSASVISMTKYQCTSSHAGIRCQLNSPHIMLLQEASQSRHCRGCLAPWTRRDQEAHRGICQQSGALLRGIVCATSSFFLFSMWAHYKWGYTISKCLPALSAVTTTSCLQLWKSDWTQIIAEIYLIAGLYCSSWAAITPGDKFIEWTHWSEFN